MNKADLANALSEANGLTKVEAKAIVDVFFYEMADALTRDERVEIRGFCSFFVKQYSAYVGRNPKTGATVQISPKKLPYFKCGKELKDRVDY
jgi:integration host factor subunit beta